MLTSVAQAVDDCRISSNFTEPDQPNMILAAMDFFQEPDSQWNPGRRSNSSTVVRVPRVLHHIFLEGRVSYEK